MQLRPEGPSSPRLPAAQRLSWGKQLVPGGGSLNPSFTTLGFGSMWLTSVQQSPQCTRLPLPACSCFCGGPSPGSAHSPGRPGGWNPSPSLMWGPEFRATEAG